MDMMAKTMVTVFLAFIAITVSAQDWQTDFGQAKELATVGNKKIILVFQGSDWCAPCIKLDREIWSTDEFKNLAKDEVVLLKADFPRRKQNKLPKEQQEHNNQLAEKYNQNGYFPLVVVLDSKGSVLGTAGYEQTTPQKYFEKLTSFN
jgi:thioredoxin-related protein